MKYISVCAGIEAATVAWHPLGWTPVLFAEIEPFPCAVLKHHYPDVPLVGDFTQLIVNPPPADLLVGGTPCQAFSVAGRRLSLEDYRGNLSLAFADLFHAGRYEWAVWENVPGVLSTKDNAFGCLLGRLVGADTPLVPGRGAKWTNAGVVSGPLATAAWRVLDAQYFGVAQRRRRIFVCVSRGAGNWAAAAALLPVGESVSRHPPTRRQAGENPAADAGTGVARSLRGQSNVAHREDVDTIVLPMNQYPELPRVVGTLSDGAHHGGGLNGQDVYSGRIIPEAVPQVLRNREGKAGGGKGPLISEDQSLTLATANDQVVFALQNPEVEKGQNGLGIAEGPMYTLESSRPHGVVAPTLSASNNPSRSPQSSEVTQQVSAVCAATYEWHNQDSRIKPVEVAGTLSVNADGKEGHLIQMTHTQMRPRRLTPRECERLQGFPDDYTLIPWKKGTAPDGPRYKALGNSMAIPCMLWIGKRIQLVEAL